MTNPAEDQLAERQAAILRAIVREFIRTGEPVGSKYLLERARLQVSSATVRNEMSRLEELGFLAQPHTSAGRVPTDAGYRFVVDEIKAPRALAEGQRRALTAELGEGAGSIDELLHRASDVVARFTHHAAAVLARRARPAKLRRLELFAMGARTASLVVIAENGRVEQRLIPLDAKVTDQDVEMLGARLSKDLQGSLLDAAVKTLDEQKKTVPERERDLVENVSSVLRSLLGSEEQVAVGGVANLAGEEDFDREELQRLYEVIERQTAVLELLTSALEPVSVRIGHEMKLEDFQSCSVVVASFGPDGARGSVGVIGPTRMDYDRVIATAHAVARVLEGTLGAPDE